MQVFAERIEIAAAAEKSSAFAANAAGRANSQSNKFFQQPSYPNEGTTPIPSRISSSGRENFPVERRAVSIEVIDGETADA